MNYNNLNLSYNPNNLNPYPELSRIQNLSNNNQNFSNNNQQFMNNNNQQFMNNNQQYINNINKTEQKNQYIGNLRRVDGLNNNSKKLPLNENLFKIKLKSHQEALLYRVLELDDKAPKTNLPFGIMSDKPGSGKTFVILALIYISIKFFNSKGANIIIVPHNIYTQWINSIEIFLGKSLKYNCLVDYDEINKLYTNSELLYKYDIIITTPLMYDIFARTINSLNIFVRRVFFDEADSMKNLLVNAINSYMTWFISASISSVFNSSNMKATIGKYELYLPTLLRNECWCLDEFIDSNIKLPKPNIEKFVCKDFYIDLILSKILNQEQIKYINAHDYSNIRQECGGKLIKTNKELLKQLYEFSNKIILDTNGVLNDLQKNKIEVSDTITKNLRKKQIYTQRLESIKLLSLNYNLCIQCFTNINKYTCYKSPCNDLICEECWEKICENSKEKKSNMSNICLTCNKIHNIDTYKEEKLYPNIKGNNFISKTKYNKFIILDNVLEICDKKIIIYSEFGGLNNYLKNYSIDYNIKIEELNAGNIKDIDRILISYRDDPKVKILLIDNAYFGIGLNMEYTTDIIFFHNIEEKLKTQLIGRAQRFGRKYKLNIWEIKYWNEDYDSQINQNKKQSKSSTESNTESNTKSEIESNTESEIESSTESSTESEIESSTNSK